MVGRQNNELGGMWKEAVLDLFGIPSLIFLVELRETKLTALRTADVSSRIATEPLQNRRFEC
jgi:hypothetical protein